MKVGVGLCCFFFFLVCGVFGQKVPLSETIKHFEPLASVRLSPEAKDHFRLTFEAFGHTFDHLLVLNQKIFSSTAKISTHYANGTVTHEPLPRIAYHGLGEEEYQVRVTLIETNAESPIFKGIFVKAGEGFMVDLLERYEDQIPEQSRKTIPPQTKMVIFRWRDEIDHKIFCGVKDLNNPHPEEEESLIRLDSRSVEQALANVTDPAINPPPVPCPQRPKSFAISFAADHHYMEKFGTRAAVSVEVTNTFNTMVPLYKQTLYLTLIMDGLSYYPDANSHAWNTQDCPTIGEKLDAFAQWRGTISSTSGLWHLLTNCYSSGTVGLAWTGVPCMTVGYPQGNDYVNGVSVSSYLPGGNAWRVTAHEIAHNMGAAHTTEGLMYPSVINVNIFSRSSQNDMCSTLGRSYVNCLIDDQTCTRNCTGRTCGSDGCGSICGTCSTDTQCIQNQCVCIPSCSKKVCGSNGCGGSCGKCSDNTFCDESLGQCLTVSQEERGKVVELHNIFRQDLVVPISYDASLELLAKSWAQTCSFTHSTPSSRNGNGENIFWGLNATIETGIKAWGAEKVNWSCPTNDCRGFCSQYLQMVTNTTTKVGCSLSNCNGGINFVVCVYGPTPVKLGTPPFPPSQCPSCNKVCAAQGRICGTVFNGCVDEFCGECPLGTECTPSGTCQALNSTSCAAERKNCGVLNLGNGVSTNCGTCSSSEVCQNGRCLCRTALCGQRNQTCGTATDDNCSSFFCGQCSSGTCVSGRCYLNETAKFCTPTTSCQAQNQQCGVLFDGCSDMKCGGCTERETCVGGQCKCSPPVQCAARKKQCGRLFDGCDQISCGICQEPRACIQGKCLLCNRCHKYATCDEGGSCRCLPGHRGDGINTCLPVGNLKYGSGSGRVVFLRGSADSWLTSGDQISHFNSGSQDLMQLDPVNQIDFRSKTTITVNVRRPSADSEGGIAWLIQDSNNFFFFSHGSGDDLKFGVNYQGNLLEFQVASQSRSSSGYVNIGVVVQSSKISFLFNGKPVGNPVVMNLGWRLGGIGYWARSGADFQMLDVQTENNFTVTLASCLTESAVKQAFAGALRISTSDITVLRRICNTTSTNKRNVLDSLAFNPEETSSGLYVINIKGNVNSSSLALMAELESMAVSDLVSLVSNGLMVKSLDATMLRVDDPNTYPVSGSSPGRSSLSIGMAVGIVVICTSAIFATALLVFVGLKKRPPEGSKATLY